MLLLQGIARACCGDLSVRLENIVLPTIEIYKFKKENIHLDLFLRTQNCDIYKNILWSLVLSTI